MTSNSVEHMCGYKNVKNMVCNISDFLEINVPVVLHLDHGTEYECLKAIENGFSSVMIDPGQIELCKQVEIINKVVEAAHSNSVTVEAQCGSFDSQTVSRTAFEESYHIIRECDVDCFAPAIGNRHGFHNEEIHLDFALLKKLSEISNVPFSFHGGSGTNENDLLLARKLGCKKFNFNTENMLAWTNGVKRFLQENEKEYHPRKIILAGFGNMEEKMRGRWKTFYR